MQLNANKIYGISVKFIKIQRAWRCEISEQNLSEKFGIHLQHLRGKINLSTYFVDFRSKGNKKKWSYRTQKK